MKTPKKMHGDFFGQLPDQSDEPLIPVRGYKAHPASLDYEKLKPYFGYLPLDIVRHTMRQTTTLVKEVGNVLLISHMKSRFQMLRHHRKMKQLLLTLSLLQLDTWKDSTVHKYTL